MLLVLVEAKQDKGMSIRILVVKEDSYGRNL